MTKKRKLNSKNPKYLKESERNERVIVQKKLLTNAVMRNSKGKLDEGLSRVPVWAVWYE